MSFNFTLFPVLNTERLILRELSLCDDIEAVFKLRSNEDINKLIKRETPKNLKDAEDFISVCLKEFNNKNRVFWAMEFDKKIIGTIVYHRISLENNYAEIGYELNPNYQQRGFMSEAMKKVLEFGINRMQLKTNPLTVLVFNFMWRHNGKCDR